MRKGGFTLIELLVVIAVIGLLASIVLVAVNSVRSKARNVKRLSDISQYALAVEMAFDANGEYPDTGDVNWRCLGDYSDNACWANGTQPLESTVLNGILDDYIPSLPADEMIICGWGGSLCYEGYLYRCMTRPSGICDTIEIHWFLEEDNQSCGIGIDQGGTCTNCTYCRYRP